MCILYIYVYIFYNVFVMRVVPPSTVSRFNAATLCPRVPSAVPDPALSSLDAPADVEDLGQQFKGFRKPECVSGDCPLCQVRVCNSTIPYSRQCDSPIPMQIYICVPMSLCKYIFL
jgi:hypothetical protein